MKKLVDSHEDPHVVRDSLGYLQGQQGWFNWWSDWNDIAIMAAVAIGETDCTSWTISWVKFAQCNGVSSTGRKNFPDEVIKSMASNAERIRICTAGSEEDCVTSFFGSTAVQQLVLGQTLNPSLCGVTCANDQWMGPRVSHMVSTCVLPGLGFTGLAGVATNRDCYDDGDCFLQACGNDDGRFFSKTYQPWNVFCP